MCSLQKQYCLLNQEILFNKRRWQSPPGFANDILCDYLHGLSACLLIFSSGVCKLFMTIAYHVQTINSEDSEQSRNNSYFVLSSICKVNSKLTFPMLR